ncbi:MAG: hypothetical protein ACM34K_06255 [Bacillota bacterium]
MKNKDNRISDSLIKDLKAATTGYLSTEDFGILVSRFNDEVRKGYYSPGVESNIHRIIFSLFDRVSFLSDAVRFPHYIQIVTAISTNSNYLTDIIIRNPEYLYWVVSPENLKGCLSEVYLKKLIHDSLLKFKSFNARINFLKAIKRREILRIGVNDIIGNNDLKKTTEQLSILARVINDELFLLCYNEILTKYEIKSKSIRYCLIALGKLGGNELNYSSDVDFILFFDKNSAAGKLEYFEILNEAALLFIKTSSTITDKGYIYRVDFRLRPDGRNSPLCRTLKDYLRYYESRGEDWERQMLIKMSFAGGSRKLYDTFNNYIQNFIYPHSFSVSPLEQISVMKSNIEKHSAGKEDVKLFSGGIRDIEFSVQALQLLNGGSLKDVRTGNTLEAIQRLESHNLLSSDETALFISAYVFYRKIEHFLQLMNDTQTHVIPGPGETLDKLSSYMGFKSSSAFQNKVEHTRKEVRKIFISITGQKDNSKDNSIEGIKFSDLKKSQSNYKYLQSGYGLLEQKQFDSQTISAFQQIEPELIHFLMESASPDIVLDNFARIIKTRPLPSIWYHEFRDKSLFNSFLKICELCQKAVDMTVTDRSLGDLILSRRVFIKEPGAPEDLTVPQAIFILSIQFSLGFITHDKVSSSLARLLSKVISDTCSRQTMPYKYFIAAMGSFGSSDMSFSSDADLIIVAENLNDYPDIQTDFQKLTAQLQDKIRPFELDYRLRPEGKSGQLVWDIKNYMEYIDKRIQTWELQSHTKLRFICGDSLLFNRLIEKAAQKTELSSKEKLKADILEMRKKIDKQVQSSPQSNFQGFFNVKKSRGGITDIEFALQFIILSEPGVFHKTHGKSTLKNLNFLLDFSEKFHSFVALKNGFSFLKSIELQLQILFNITTSVLPLDAARRQILSNVLGFADQKEFEAALLKITKINKDLVEDIWYAK